MTIDVTKLYIKLQQTNITVKELAEEFKVGESTIIRYKKQLEEAKLKGIINELIDVDRAVLLEAGDKLDLRAESNNITKNIDGLEILKTSLQQTAEMINNKIQNKLVIAGDDINSVDLTNYTAIISQLQSAFFNKNSVAVNVQNNNFSGDKVKYNEYLEDIPCVEHIEQ